MLEVNSILLIIFQVKFGLSIVVNTILANARIVYERAIEFFGDSNMDEKLYVAFAKFEENQREVCIESNSSVQALIVFYILSF